MSKPEIDKANASHANEVLMLLSQLGYKSTLNNIKRVLAQTDRNDEIYIAHIDMLRSLATNMATRISGFAVIWFILGLVVGVAAIAALMSKAPFITPALLMMSVTLFMLSAQRTERFVMEPTKFKKRIQFFCFATVILSSLSIVFNAAV
ncbi:hypothetical protein [Bowmanella denitrificans]|uniref:hypothetical protein n=1 Tax=Bowmanella denitrificans TaxID=366582 RepID=UPI0011AF770A|nr:hypothetical protein [Bowmanella denitrificans]